MAWLALTVTLDAGRAEALSDALLEHGAVSVEMFGAPGPGGEPEALAEGDGPVLAERIQVGALLPEGADAAALFAAAATSCGLEPPPEYRSRRVADQDWVRISRDQFQPVRISQRLWIVPSWHAAPDPAAVNLVLDPGLAFGTGTHPTTRLCLSWLDEHLRGGEDVLDYGCGSGILAIAALKLGARRATGVDIDRQAVDVSRENAAANRVEAIFHTAQSAPPLKADIVLANILSNPLKVLAPALAAAARPGGRVVLSGILSQQAEEVAAIYREWFDMEAPVVDEGWVCLAGTRRAHRSER
jgi:ribosomal protein L11 methyltransferase